MLLLFIIIVTFFGRKYRYFLTVAEILPLLQFFVCTTMIGIFPIHVLFIGMDLMQSHLKCYFVSVTSSC